MINQEILPQKGSDKLPEKSRLQNVVYINLNINTRRSDWDKIIYVSKSNFKLSVEI